MKLTDDFFRVLTEKVEQTFPDRGYYPKKLNGQAFFQVWTSWGTSINGIHYEYYVNDDEVQLHFENDDINFSSNESHYLSETLKQKTKNNPNLNDNLKWRKWQGGESCRCKYTVKMTSADASADKVADNIIDGFKYLIEVFDNLIFTSIKNRTMNECIRLLESNHNLILTGAPGTGKTFLAKKIAAKIILGEDYDDSNNKVEQDPRFKERCRFVQFHPSYDYTDFVEGLRPINKDGNIGFERQDGIFKQFCKKALKDDPTKQYVFIIDEINRGDISKILGELFFSIDPGYRGEKGRVKTQYQNLIEKGDEYDDGFYVPENVYIIGTMNDIDRSVESMDFAMRRRFAWKEITAERQISMLDKLLKTDDDIIYPMDAEEIKKVENRLKNLNDEIVKEKYGLSAAYHIGPSYFLKLGLYETDRFESLWNNHIKGVLYEYLRGNEEIDELIEDLRKAYNNDQDKDPKVADKQEQTNEKASESEA